MKKITTYTLASTLLFSSMSSCGTMDSRSYLGTMAGAEIGGTIGELSDGWQPAVMTVRERQCLVVLSAQLSEPLSETVFPARANVKQRLLLILAKR